jgi:peroxiredoxin Q/BCP
MKIGRTQFLAAGAAAVAVASVARPASAAIEVGAAAPMFTLPATLGTEVFQFDLAAQLKKGPVVLYFYPAAFTKGCTIEAHDFADHMEDYKKEGASVIGVSGDDIEKLKKFSTSECRSKFPVAADEGLKVAAKYDAVLKDTYANRTSYVIAPNGKIAYVYSSLDPDKHVGNTLEAVRKITGKS